MVYLVIENDSGELTKKRNKVSRGRKKNNTQHQYLRYIYVQCTYTYVHYEVIFTLTVINDKKILEL